MAERLKKRRFNEISQKMGFEKDRLEKLMPDSERFAEGVYMPHKLRILFLEFGLGVLDMAAGKTDEVCVNIPRAGRFEFKLEEKK